MSHRAPDRATVRKWNAILRPYLGADTRRSATQLLTSALPFAALWYAMLWSLDVGYWLTLLLAVPATGFMMRLFMIQHDCGHGSFFNSRRARNAVGFVIGVLLLTPYDYWRKTHAYHHAHSGDLDFRGFGDIDTFTVREYLSWTPWERLKYRMYRHPLVLFTIGPAFHFIVKHRFPWDIPRDWKQAWRSVWLTNLAIGGILTLAWATVGLGRFFLVQTPITLMACSLGVWLFYVQHQFEHTYWDEHEEWDYYEASLHGSSFLKLPGPLQWITANIGVHHVHHMSARIPNYKLQEVHDQNPEFHAVTTLTARDSWRLIWLALWDEDSRRLIRFKDVGEAAATARFEEAA